MSLAVLRDRPGALLVEAESGESATLRRLLGRARATAQEQLPALLLLPPHSLWLRAALPPEVMPALALASDAADGDALGRALGALAPSADAPRPQAAQSELWLDRQQRTLSGPAGAAQLTASEASLLAAILDGDGAVITTERVAELLWGGSELDRRRRAAIRSHVHTLRRKLHEIGMDGAVVTLPGVGYRLALPGEGD